MANYRFDKRKFIIEDFQRATPFCSFLPAVAGKEGKPIWAFYASVGQAMGGFGATSKQTPIVPFDSAHLAYENIGIRGFRTFLKFGDLHLTPFFGESAAKRNMETSLYDLKIEEIGEGYTIAFTYSGIPHESFPGLIRKMELTNTSDKTVSVSGVDGLPIFLPLGLSNGDYKQLVSLMEAYCEVNGLGDRLVFAKFKTSTGDNSVVALNEKGNGYFAKDQDGRLLLPIADPAMVFGDDLSLLTAKPFFEKNYSSFTKTPQQRENKLPSAFFAFATTLKPGETYTAYEVFGSFVDEASFREAESRLGVRYIETLREQNEELVTSLIGPAYCHSGNETFDLFVAQSYLDNNLRGGFPSLIAPGVPYYLYGRKHGDMERDYNDFVIPASYYSSGPGNFRDVNQNRRNDLFFAPFVGDYNIRLFYSLIQIDGQNPLNVKPETFVLSKKDGAKKFLKKVPTKSQEGLNKILSRPFEPREVLTYLIDEAKLEKWKASAMLEELLPECHQEIEANFAEGYWIDHWTYNVDLLENYASIYPDKLSDLLFEKGYHYFYSPVYVEPRFEKYCLLPDGRIRQYGAIDLKGLREYCRKENIDLTKTAWLTDKEGHRVDASLAEKLLSLILVKFSTLDSLQMGVEMECEKPGWNDAMNGLPGLFASGLSETVELLRSVRFLASALEKVPGDKKVELLEEQYELYEELEKNLRYLLHDKVSRFDYWDAVTSARETLREKCRYHVDGKKAALDVSSILSLLSSMDKVLTSGIKRAKEAGNGILPSYLIYRVKTYEPLKHVNHLGYQTVKATSFDLETIPPFLEASARALKLGSEFIEKKDLQAIKESGLYDQKLKIYKTCAAIDEVPFEIGRVHAFTKGWLERECDFLHMSYKYLLGLLKAGYYKEWEEEAATNLTMNLDPKVYGRNPTEASSFIVPTCNPDSSKHGRGFFARLSGANAEMLNMYVILFAGEKAFELRDGELSLNLKPRLPLSLYDEKGEASFTFLGQTLVTYSNPEKIDTLLEDYHLTYVYDGKESPELKGEDALRLRNGEIKKLVVRISR